MFGSLQTYSRLTLQGKKTKDLLRCLGYSRGQSVVWAGFTGGKIRAYDIEEVGRSRLHLTWLVLTTTTTTTTTTITTTTTTTTTTSFQLYVSIPYEIKLRANRAKSRARKGKRTKKR